MSLKLINMDTIMLKTFLFLLLSTLLSAAIYDGVAVVVQDRAITLLDIKDEMRISGVGEKEATDNLIRQKMEEAEIEKRNISVSSEDVYKDIKQMAKRNQMGLSEFYDAVRETNGLSSSELKAKIKQKLLGQKLYSAIAYSSVKEPSESEIEEYYKAHKEEFTHPAAFNVIVYKCAHKEKLQQKIENPMFYSPDITSEEIELPYEKISPSLGKLLEDTPLNSCTPSVPDGKGKYVSFYLKSIAKSDASKLEDIKSQIMNLIMAKQREQVLSDYFARLRDKSDINTIRGLAE